MRNISGRRMAAPFAPGCSQRCDIATTPSGPRRKHPGEPETPEGTPDAHPARHTHGGRNGSVDEMLQKDSIAMTSKLALARSLGQSHLVENRLVREAC